MGENCGLEHFKPEKNEKEERNEKKHEKEEKNDKKQERNEKKQEKNEKKQEKNEKKQEKKEEKKEETEDENICCICMEKPRTHAPVPCGHMIYCEDCILRCGKTCAKCRTPITSIMKIYK